MSLGVNSEAKGSITLTVLAISWIFYIVLSLRVFFRDGSLHPSPTPSILDYLQ
jgi:hypothetical protein